MFFPDQKSPIYPFSRRGTILNFPFPSLLTFLNSKRGRNGFLGFSVSKIEKQWSYQTERKGKNPDNYLIRHINRKELKELRV